LFTITEKTSVLTAQQIPAGPNGTTSPLLANVSIVPSDLKFNGSFFGAEILISEPSKNFPDPLIYVSNRNLGPEFDPRGDSIAIFEFKSSPLSPAAAGNVDRRFHSRKWQARDESPSITVVNSITGNLTLLSQVFTGLKQVRSMALGRVADGGDEFLVAGANVDGGVVVFKRTDGGRNLSEVARNTDIANRTSFVFV
jgi:hypothetical protein